MHFFRFLVCAIFLVCAGALLMEDELGKDLKEQSMLYGVAEASRRMGRDDTVCAKELNEFLNAVKLRKLWALKMLDSSGEEVEGYLFTNFLWPGSMSQCRDINVDNRLMLNDDNPELVADSMSPYGVEFVSVLFQHNNTMQIQLNIPNNKYLQIGLCFPKSCTTIEVRQLVDQILVERNLNTLRNYPVEISVVKVKSLAAENIDWTTHPIFKVTIGIFLVTFILTMVGSWYDVCVHRPFKKRIEAYASKHKEESHKKIIQVNNWWSKILLCYSVPSNLSSLFNTNMKAENSMPFIHGLKSFSMFLIVAVHYPLYMSFMMYNIYHVFRYGTLAIFQIATKGAFTVDTYFTLGGFLISYIFCNSHKDKRPYSLQKGIKMYIQMILHRIIRLLPAYCVMVFLVVSLWRWMDQTYPLFRSFDCAAETCSTYWWRNLLFITTWFPRSEMCITWTWYLSADMQFYALNCAVLILATVYPKTMLWFLKLLVVFSICYSSYTSYSTGYRITIDAEMLEEYMYYSFLIRMAPYFVGVIAGYYFSKWNSKLPLCKNGIKYGWWLCLATFMFIFHGMQYPNRVSMAYSAFYVGMSKSLWGSVVAWLIMTCISGNGGVFNRFMSMSCWIPFSRISFCVYLTNIIVVNVYGYTGESPIYFSAWHETTFAVGNIVLCFFFGLAFSILFESPFIQLIKLLMSSGKKKNLKVEDNVKLNNI